MARIRTIKPEIAQDVKLASVSRDARYTFVLLITQSDDEGLIAGAHRQLLGTLYPHDEAVTTAHLLGWVEELVSIGLLRWRATTDGAPVLEITNWTKHQRVDNKGRSQLSGLLKPVAVLHREPPRDAELRGLEVGSRTKDLGPRKMEQAPSSADEFTAKHDCGRFAPAVASLIRSSRSPAAAIAELEMHIQGEMGYEPGTPLEVGAAAQQMVANGETWKSALFAGYLRTAKKGATRTGNRKRNAVEEQTIAREVDGREQAEREMQEADRFVEKFAAAKPERYAELKAQVERSVPTNIQLGRDDMIRGQLLTLIRREAA